MIKNKKKIYNLKKLTVYRITGPRSIIYRILFINNILKNVFMFRNVQILIFNVNCPIVMRFKNNFFFKELNRLIRCFCKNHIKIIKLPYRFLLFHFHLLKTP